jgi:hypothetical protein
MARIAVLPVLIFPFGLRITPASFVGLLLGRATTF